jgi:cyclopropane-fatty-acyl-phospholipid synthase
MTLASPSYSGDHRIPRVDCRLGWAGRLLDRALPALQAGRLQIVLPDGAVVVRHGREPGPEAKLSVQKWRALRRILLEGDRGFSDGYLDGDWSTPDLGRLLALFMRNEAVLAPRSESGWLTLVRDRLLHWRRANTRGGSRRNIAAHYDLGNDFFLPWLDSGMNYSAALYADGDTFEQAQQRKLARATSLLELGGGERVLEIGCGWGALAEWLIRGHGARVCGITLSREQLAYAKTRLAGEVEDGRADLRLQDYRDVDGLFDRVVSIEMIEAVGERYWPIYFGKMRACLAAGGIAVIQAITIDERRFAEYRKRPDFIQRHIFPGGMLPTGAMIERHAARHGLRLIDHESFGGSYARTLREWRDRFARAWPTTIEALGFDQRFQRMWEYYLSYCEIGFQSGAVDVGFFKLAG